MGRAQSQYLRIFDTSNVVYQRWQSYYVNTTVSWDSASWLYVPFVAEGFTAGISGDEANMVISAPAIDIVINAFESAIRYGHLAELSIYQFDSYVDNNIPQTSQTLIGRSTGQVVGGTGNLTNIAIQLGNAISPVGAQIPPRKMTTAIIGKGCIL